MPARDLIESDYVDFLYDPVEFDPYRDSDEMARRDCWRVQTADGEKIDLIILDGICRGGTTLFVLSKEGTFYYIGESPEHCSDGMCIIGDWVDAEELPRVVSQQRIEKFEIEVPADLQGEVDWCDDYELCKGCERAYRDQGSDLCGPCNDDKDGH